MDDLLSDVPEEEIKQKYIVEPETKPSGQLGIFIDNYFRTKDKELAYKVAEFKRDSLDKVLTRLEIEGKEYWDFLQNSNEKIILTKEQYDNAYKVFFSIKSNPFTKKQLEPEGLVDVFKQLEIYWNYKGTPCKALLDMIVFDNSHQKFYIKDFKTTGFHISEFPKSFLRFRYDLQAAFYADAVYWYCENFKDEKGNYPYANYTLGDFTFIVESTKYIGTPLIYRCNELDLHCGKYGGTGKDGREYKGYKQLLNELLWHIKNDEWEYSKEAIENDGVVEINAFKEEDRKRGFKEEQNHSVLTTLITT